jgi:hypothetical protein
VTIISWLSKLFVWSWAAPSTPCAWNKHPTKGLFLASKETGRQHWRRPRRKEKHMAKLNEAARDHIPATKFAFPKQRKEPLENASHVRNAAARFNQVEGVTAAERRAAWKRIETAAKKFKVELKSRHTS